MGLFRRRTTPQPSRPPVADLDTASVEVGEGRFALAETLVAARVDGPGLAVIVYHPAFADLPEEPRAEAGLEMLVATLGEDGLRQTVTQVDLATYPPIDPFDLTALRAFVRSLGVAVDPPDQDG